MSGGSADRASDATTNNSPRCSPVCEQRRLRVVGQRQLVGRPFEAELAEREAQSIVNLLENLPRFRKLLGEILTHAGFLRPLTGKQKDDVHSLKADYHRRPREAGAESDKKDRASLVNLPPLDCFVDSNWNRGRRRVAEAVYVDVHLFHWNAGMFGRRFDNANVGLMRN